MIPWSLGQGLGPKRGGGGTGNPLFAATNKRGESVSGCPPPLPRFHRNHVLSPINLRIYNQQSIGNACWRPAVTAEWERGHQWLQWLDNAFFLGLGNPTGAPCPPGGRSRLGGRQMPSFGQLHRSKRPAACGHWDGGPTETPTMVSHEE